MRYLLILICLFLSSNYAFSQEIEIFGKVTDNKGQPLSGATIIYLEALGTITDKNGDFYIETAVDKSIQLTIRFIGYTTVDTTFDVGNKSNIFPQIKMAPEITELPDIEITSTYQNIFENYKHHIVDFTISNDFFFLIIKKGRKSFLCVANLKGVILEEMPFDEGYSKFHNSCLGGTILVGKVNCAELHYMNDQLIITNEFNIDYFDNYMLPCKLKINDNLIFKTASRHNKKIDFFTFEEYGEPLIFHTVHDQIGERVSRSYFNDIMREYYKSQEDPHHTDIDYGFERDIIIPPEFHSDDLLDLIISDTIQELVLQYQALGKKEVQSDLFVIDKQIYILDQLNDLVLKVTDDFDVVKIDCLFEFNDDVSIITDNENSTYLQDENDLYSITPDEEGLTIHQKATLDYIYFTNRIQLYNDTLYRLGRKSANKIRTSLFRNKLD